MDYHKWYKWYKCLNSGCKLLKSEQVQIVSNFYLNFYILFSFKYISSFRISEFSMQTNFYALHEDNFLKYWYYLIFFFYVILFVFFTLLPQ